MVRACSTGPVVADQAARDHQEAGDEYEEFRNWSVQEPRVSANLSIRLHQQGHPAKATRTERTAVQWRIRRRICSDFQNEIG